MTNWERVALRVQANKLRKWDAVCTPFDPDLGDDEFPNSFPHLYDDRSKLIREAVEELISRETGELDSSSGEVTADTSAVEEKVELVREDTREILDVVEAVQAHQDEVYSRAVGTGESITTELYEIIPTFDDMDEAVQGIYRAIDTTEKFQNPVDGRGRSWGYWLDIVLEFPNKSQGEVLDALRELERDVESVVRIDHKGYFFFVEVEDE
ncbi:hypothetical protein HZS55_13040 [Halosimplex rubrum]|uniref:Uncharacterized protein n=1 Tax=Halosimplex rubrum TaxID=869889 RepID=A0A7D5TPJ3_9EURY|nr:hypothetical protein [Halosimplex rubrum]QLH78174.1 hypothetical protein HZS55_13040 [Halosimplex rubrum]